MKCWKKFSKIQKRNQATIAFFVLIKKTYEKYLQKFGLHYLNIETIFMNTENSKTNESNKCIYQITDKLNLKTPNKKKYWIS